VFLSQFSKHLLTAVFSRADTYTFVNLIIVFYFLIVGGIRETPQE